MTPYRASLPLSSHKCNCIMSSETGAFAQVFFFLFVGQVLGTEEWFY